jgi:hypothetical protein
VYIGGIDGGAVGDCVDCCESCGALEVAVSQDPGYLEGNGERGASTFAGGRGNVFDI